MRHSRLEIVLGDGQPSGRAAFQAGVIIPLLAFLVTACSDDFSTSSIEIRDIAGQRINTRVYRCVGSVSVDPFAFTARLGPGELALWLPLDFGHPYLVLAQDFTLPEATYGEGDVQLALAQDTADIRIADESFRDCEIDRIASIWEHAKLSGVDYRATGDDPTWSVEIRRGGLLTFATAPGGVLADARAPEPETENLTLGTTYRAEVEGKTLTVEISAASCAPADGTGMSGSEVFVTWDGVRYTGCGRALH